MVGQIPTEWNYSDIGAKPLSRNPLLVLPNQIGACDLVTLQRVGEEEFHAVSKRLTGQQNLEVSRTAEETDARDMDDAENNSENSEEEDAEMDEEVPTGAFTVAELMEDMVEFPKAEHLACLERGD
eukprot:s3710_g3.t1